MPTFETSPGVHLHYLVDDFTEPWGEPATILLLHGNAESSRAWYAWVPLLARRFGVVRPDMRGYGASTPMPRDFKWSLDVIIDDYAASLIRSRSGASIWSARRSAASSRAPSPRAGRSAS
jgi:pimeloyl-ACP methyl ester carboxylesterase